MACITHTGSSFISFQLVGPSSE